MKEMLLALMGTAVFGAAVCHAQMIETIAGGYIVDGGPAAEANFLELNDIHGDGGGNLYLADANRIRRIDATTGDITTLAGNGEWGGTPAPAMGGRLSRPRFLCPLA